MSMQGGIYYLHTEYFPIAKYPYPLYMYVAVEEDYHKEKEHLLQAEVYTTSLKRVSRAKDQQILVLEEELQAKKMKMASLSDQFGQQQRELDMIQQKGKLNMV